MIEDRKYIRDLKAFTRADLTTADLPQLESEMYGGSDRARVLMLGAIVEAFLQIFLIYHARPTLTNEDRRQLFDYNGPLGDFAAKLIIGYAFNWYGPETRNDLTLIRILRNKFAHSRRSFDLTSPSVADVCANLKSPARHGYVIPHTWIRIAEPTEGTNASDVNHPRTRFITACHIMAEGLLVNAGHRYAGSFAIDLY